MPFLNTYWGIFRKFLDYDVLWWTWLHGWLENTGYMVTTMLPLTPLNFSGTRDSVCMLTLSSRLSRTPGHQPAHCLSRTYEMTTFYAKVWMRYAPRVRIHAMCPCFICIQGARSSQPLQLKTLRWRIGIIRWGKLCSCMDGTEWYVMHLLQCLIKIKAHAV